MEIKIIQNQNQVYRKEKLLGEGAFGKAYLVKKLKTQQMLVIKEMNIEHMSTKQKEQTIKEALILKNLNHPNIVNFKQVYATKNNKLKIVMEYAECGDLARTIHQRKATKNYISQGQVLDWFTQICLAIKHVHDRKILHRDIKGQNIFLAKNNSLKLGDFGIARILNKTIQKARTVVGTPYYLSPQIIQNKPYSFKSDIWSMGAVLYEMCALQPPFNANSLQMLALKIVKGSYSPLQGTYSKDLKILISEMLTLDPYKRPTVNEILNKSIIQDRIKHFLTETKRVSQFSHTILHNQKVDLGGVNNRLVQIQKQKYNKSNSSKEKNIEKERIKLKQEQQRIQEIMKRKKLQEERKKRYSQQKKRKQYENRIRQQQKKREQARLKQQAKRQWLQKQKKMRIIEQRQREEARRKQVQKQIVMKEYQQNRRMAQMFKRNYQDDQKYRQERQRESVERRKNQQEYRMRKEYEKQIQKQKKQVNFQEQARRQYFQNMEIRKRAEERARKERQGDNIQFLPQQQQKVNNYHNAQKRPTSKKQSSRPSSSGYRSTKQSQPPSKYNLLNVQFKVQQVKQKSSQKSNNNRRVSQSELRQIQNDKDEKKKKIQEAREKMKRDRERFMQNNINLNKNIPEKDNDNYQKTKVGKWQKRKSSQKRDSSKQASPRFGNIQSPKKYPFKQDDVQIIKDSDNLFLEVKNHQQFNDYINELQDLVKGVNKKVQVLQQIPLSQEIMFREDDELQYSLTLENRSENQELKKMKNQEADLDYFSDYSKLQILRMQLQEAFGLQNFIKLYRMIEDQVREKGLQGFDLLNIQKQVCSEINRQTFAKNITLLLTLVSLQDRMNYN